MPLGPWEKGSLGAALALCEICYDAPRTGCRTYRRCQFRSRWWETTTRGYSRNALREECNNSEERSSIGSEFFKHGRVKRELDCGSEAPVMLGLQYTRPPLLPFVCQLTHVPLFLMPNCGKRRDRKWVEVELTRSDWSSLS